MIARRSTVSVVEYVVVMLLSTTLQQHGIHVQEIDREEPGSLGCQELMFDGSIPETPIEDVRVAAGVSSSQVYHYFKDKKALVQAVIVYLDETIVGGQEPMLVTLDSREGPRAWRDFLVKYQEEELGCRGLLHRVAGQRAR